MWKKDEKHAYLVMTYHPIYIHLWQKYSLNVKKKKKVEDDTDNIDDSEDKQLCWFLS